MDCRLRPADLYTVPCQVAELQGTAKPAQLEDTNTTATSSSTDAVEGEALEGIQQWLRLQADSFAHASYLPYRKSASQLSFLPDFMTKAAAEPAADPDLVTMAVAEQAAAPEADVADHSIAGEQSGCPSSAALGPDTIMAGSDQKGVAGVSAQQLLSQQNVPENLQSAASGQQTGHMDTIGCEAPKTWLEWEQQIQV